MAVAVEDFGLLLRGLPKGEQTEGIHAGSGGSLAFLLPCLQVLSDIFQFRPCRMPALSGGKAA